MVVDDFSERLARVRLRFASRLEGKIEAAHAALHLTGEGAAEAVSESYRCVHGIVGIGPTFGFEATGRAARDVVSLLQPAYRTRRGLNEQEIEETGKALHALRAAAQEELQTIPGLQ